MSRLDGGIFSRPRGKTANIVFGAARTREGKVVTARELVPPSNPQTQSQQEQRGIFSESLAIVRALGSDIYQADWNRAISQLPGFQSMMSLYMNAMDISFLLSAPPNVNLGNLYYADLVTVDPGNNPNEITVVYDGHTQGQATNQDEPVIFAVEAAAAADPADRDVVISTNGTISAGEETITVANAGTDYIVGLYFRGKATLAGLISQARFYSVTSAV